MPAIIVAERPGGLEPADSTFLSQTVDSFVGTEGFGDASSPPIPSADGQALQMFLPVDSTLEVKGQRESAARGRWNRARTD